MTNTNVNAASLQIVHGGDGGGAVRATAMQVQVVTADHVSRLVVSNMAAQVVRSGDGGAAIKVPAEGLQVVYITTVPERPPQKAWTYTLDGHTFYVLDLGEEGSLVYDLATQQWTRHETTGYGGHWNMKNGFQWLGGNKIVAGDIIGPTIFFLDPDGWLDDGWRPVSYEVRGVVFATDVGVHRTFALRLIGSSGRTTDEEAPVINMQYSDDNGATWSRERTVELTMDKKQRIVWRSLGAFSFPGRIFRLYDDGGVKFIAAVVAEIEGES